MNYLNSFTTYFFFCDYPDLLPAVAHTCKTYPHSTPFSILFAGIHLPLGAWFTLQLICNFLFKCHIAGEAFSDCLGQYHILPSTSCCQPFNFSSVISPLIDSVYVLERQPYKQEGLTGKPCGVGVSSSLLTCVSVQLAFVDMWVRENSDIISVEDLKV